MEISNESVQEIEKFRRIEIKKELGNIISNTPRAVLEGILFSSIPVGIITGIGFGVGVLTQYFTKDKSILQHPFFQAMGYGFVGSLLDFICLGLYSSWPSHGGYEAIEPDCAIENISESMRKRKELKNMTQEEICSRYLSN